MKAENAIEVKKIKKSFRIYYDKGHTLKEKLLFRNRRAYEERVVLDGISFEVKKGEAIGLIGQNGCGKSTTLKLLTRIMYPDSGSIEMKGRVSSLIELGAGFHPDMSGRENIYINASIFGLTKKEIERRIEEIIEFSELEEYIDNPVRTYSSGMYMRLAFSVAINVDADILLIDEILAVGDAAFQAKCFNKLREIKARGTTIVIVSHSLGQIEQICERSIWIHEGKIQKEGNPREVHPVYLEFMGQKQTQKTVEKEVIHTSEEQVQEVIKEKDDKNIGSFDVKIGEVKLFNDKGENASVFMIGTRMKLVVNYERVNKNIIESEFGINISRNDGVGCYGTNTLIDKVEKVKLKEKGEIVVIFEKMQLLQGKYTIDVAFHDEFGFTYHHRYGAVAFEVMNMYGEVGIVRLEHKWIFDGREVERN